MGKELDAMIKKLQKKSKKDYDKTHPPEVKKVPNSSGKLTDEQVENWRRILFQTMGPIVIHLSKEEIQKIRDQMQEDVYKL